MRFFVDDIIEHTSKCNYITFHIVDTDTILDGCKVYGYAPKSVNLILGIIQDIPYFVCKGIFGFNCMKNIKTLEHQLQAKAPKGQKRIWRSQARDLFNEIAKLNVEETREEKEPIGKFVGEVNNKLLFLVESTELLFTSELKIHKRGFYWRSYLWKIIDFDGNVYIFKTSGKRTHEKLSNMKHGTIIECEIVSHSVFNGVKQTQIRNVKFNTGLFKMINPEV